MVARRSPPGARADPTVGPPSRHGRRRAGGRQRSAGGARAPRNRSTSTRASSGGTSSGRRARRPVSSWAYARLPGRAGGTLAASTRVLGPLRIRRGVWRSGASPARCRYGDRPFWGGSRRSAVAPRAFERKVRRIVRSPLDLSSIPKRGVRRFLFLPASGVPVDARSRRRSVAAQAGSRPAAAPAGRGPRRRSSPAASASPTAIAPRPRRPSRRRRRNPRPSRRPRRPRRRPGRSPSRTTRGSRSRSRPSRQDRLDHQRGDRDPVRARRRRPGRRQGRGVQRVSGRGRRRPGRRQVRLGRRREDRRPTARTS